MFKLERPRTGEARDNQRGARRNLRVLLLRLARRLLGLLPLLLLLRLGVLPLLLLLARIDDTIVSDGRAVVLFDTG